LHDVIEDSELTLSDLQNEGFSEEILHIVDLLTHYEKDSYTKYIEPTKDEKKIMLGEIDLNIGGTLVDYRIIESTVYDVQSGVSAKNEEFGRYALSDKSLIADANKKSTVTLFVHPKEAIWEKGSDIISVGVIGVVNDVPGFNPFFICEMICQLLPHFFHKVSLHFSIISPI